MILDKIFSHSGSLPKTADPFYWMSHMMRTGSSADKDVTEYSAVTLASYFACIRNLSEDIATLPLHVYSTKKNGGRSLENDSDVAKLLRRRPNYLTSPWSFRSTLMVNAASWGNAYAEIVRDVRGRPAQLWLIHPSRVTLDIDTDDDGRTMMVYKVYGEANGKHYETVIEPRDMIHLKGMSIDGFEGISMLQAAAEVIGVSLAEQEFTGKFLGNGATLSGVLTTPKTLSSDAHNRLRESWATAFKGSNKAGKAAILEQDMKWTPLSIPQRDAQFLEQRMFTVVEACRFWRMPPHKIMHLENATYSNIESQDRQYVNDTMMPWLVRLEEELSLKLLSPQQINQGWFFSHKIEGRLRGDSEARSKFYNTMLFNGTMTHNEVRALENMDPMGPEGDIHFMQSAMTTVEGIIDAAEKAAEEPEPVPPALAQSMGPEDPTDPVDSAPDSTPDSADSTPEDDEEEMEAALRILIEAAADRVVRKTLKATSKERDEEWLGRFYKEQAGYLGQELRPIQKAFRVSFSACPTVEMLYDTEKLTDFLMTNKYWIV